MTSTRGRTFVGTVIADKMHKTVTVEWEGKRYVPKFERYSKTRTRVKAHNPENINAKVGNVVQIMETRPVSKTKNFVVTKVLKDGEAPQAPTEPKGKAKPKKELEKNAKKAEAKKVEEKNESN